MNDDSKIKIIGVREDAPTQKYYEDEKSAEKTVKIGVLISSIGVGVFMASIDGTITNVSLPDIAIGLGVDQTSAQWVILAYLLTIIGFTAIAGDIGDRFSNKMVLQIGMIIFTFGSLLCAFSTSLLWLVLARILQALGACCGMANGTAIITRFTTHKNRGTALGLNAVIVAAGLTLGPIVGGLLTDSRFGWPSIFMINVPIGIIGFIYVHFAIPKTPPLNDDRREADFIGSISFMLFLTLFVFSLTVFVDENFQNGILWGLVTIGISVIMFFVFIFWERRTFKPIIDLKMFNNRRFAFGILAAVLAYLGLNVIFYQLPFYLKEIQELDTIRIGLIILGTPIAMAIVGPLAGKLSDRIDPKYPATFGMIGIAIDLMILAIFLKADSPYWFFFIASAILGVALGSFLSPNSNSIMSAAPKAKLGIASSLMNLSSNVGFSLGTALSTAAFAALKISFRNINGGELGDIQNYIPAMRIMFAIFAVVVFLAAFASFLRGSQKRI